MEIAERASRSGRTGQAGQGCDCGLWRSRDKLLLGLADKVSKDGRGRESVREGAQYGRRGRGTDRVAVRREAGASLLLMLLLLLLLLHATRSRCVRVACCGGHKERAAATGGQQRKWAGQSRA